MNSSIADHLRQSIAAVATANAIAEHHAELTAAVATAAATAAEFDRAFAAYLAQHGRNS